VKCLQYVLARIFGTNDALFSREAEQDIFRRVAQVGLGPKLLVRATTLQNSCCLSAKAASHYSQGPYKKSEILPQLTSCMYEPKRAYNSSVRGI
jgi:hypothetical protein